MTADQVAELRQRVGLDPKPDRAAPPLQRVTRGRMVHTFGPWSNGHDEQCAIVTHVRGDGDAPGTLVNLHVFVDDGPSMLAISVPWFATRAEAVASMVPNDAAMPEPGPRVCWFPDRD